MRRFSTASPPLRALRTGAAGFHQASSNKEATRDNERDMLQTHSQNSPGIMVAAAVGPMGLCGPVLVPAVFVPPGAGTQLDGSYTQKRRLRTARLHRIELCTTLLGKNSNTEQFGQRLAGH